MRGDHCWVGNVKDVYQELSSVLFKGWIRELVRNGALLLSRQLMVPSCTRSYKSESSV